MKKMLVAVLAVALIGALAFSATAGFDRTYTAAQGTPTIDGEVDEMWSKVEWTSVDKPYDGSVDTTATLRVKLLWNDRNLYLLAEVFDETYNAELDVVEVYLDQNQDKGEYGDDDYQTRFKVSGSVVTGEHAGKNSVTYAPVAAKSLGEDKYLLEAEIAWPNVLAELGDTMGLEFMYNDAGANDTDPLACNEALRWNVDTANGDTPSWQGTNAFGTLILADEGTTSSSESTSTTESTTSTTESTTSTTESTTSTTASTTESTTSTTASTTSTTASTTTEEEVTTTTATVAEEDEEKAPQTGVAAPVAMIVAAALAAGGVAISKKR